MCNIFLFIFLLSFSITHLDGKFGIFYWNYIKKNKQKCWYHMRTSHIVHSTENKLDFIEISSFLSHREHFTCFRRNFFFRFFLYIIRFPFNSVCIYTIFWSNLMLFFHFTSLINCFSAICSLLSSSSNYHTKTSHEKKML